jgi:hypothetical protein
MLAWPMPYGMPPDMGTSAGAGVEGESTSAVVSAGAGAGMLI